MTDYEDLAAKLDQCAPFPAETRKLMRSAAAMLRSQGEEVEKCRSALQIIQTWATFEYGELPAGHALVPEHVAELCKKALGETK